MLFIFYILLVHKAMLLLHYSRIQKKQKKKKSIIVTNFEGKGLFELSFFLLNLLSVLNHLLIK